MKIVCMSVTTFAALVIAGSLAPASASSRAVYWVHAPAYAIAGWDGLRHDTAVSGQLPPYDSFESDAAVTGATKDVLAGWSDEAPCWPI
jgi:hypothetical protein